MVQNMTERGDANERDIVDVMCEFSHAMSGSVCCTNGRYIQ